MAALLVTSPRASIEKYSSRDTKGAAQQRHSASSTRSKPRDGVRQTATRIRAKSGNAYVTGSTSTIDFPTTSGAYNRTIGRQCIHSDPCFTSDGFVTKINARGTGLVYSTFVNGPGAQPAFH